MRALPAIDASALAITESTVTINRVTGVTCTRRAAMACFTTEGRVRVPILCGMTMENDAKGIHSPAIVFVSFQLLIVSQIIAFCLGLYI